MRRTRVKICGITRSRDAHGAAAAGADAVGLVFYSGSPRVVDAGLAASIATALPPLVTRVGLFVDAEADFVRTILDRVPIDVLQFHGNEPAGYCRNFGRPYIKALRVRRGLELKEMESSYADAIALLLDAHVEGSSGGTGRTFDWDLIPRLVKPIILAGGLSAQNVGEAVRRIRPYAVDVSSGVESATGVKDAEKMAAFIGEVMRADAESA